MGKILLVLADTPFQSERVTHVINISRAALRMGHRVSIFLFMDGVYNMLQTQRGEVFKVSSVTDELADLAKMGARIMCCRLCSEIRGLGGSMKPDFVDDTGVGELNEEYAESDAVLSFIGGS